MNKLLLEASIKSLNSAKSYDKYISQFPKGNPSKLKLGTCWTYHYDFYKDYPQEIIKYFDKRPLVIFVSHWKQKNLWGGINVHFLPVLLRAQFFNKIKSRNLVQFKKPGIHPIRINYNIVKEVLYKAKWAFRWYRPEAISQAFTIPNSEWVNASQYQISSFYKVDINQIVDRYKGWDGPPKKQRLKESLGFDFEAFQGSQEVINMLNENSLNPYPIF